MNTNTNMNSEQVTSRIEYGPEFVNHPRFSKYYVDAHAIMNRFPNTIRPDEQFMYELECNKILSHSSAHHKYLCRACGVNRVTYLLFESLFAE